MILLYISRIRCERQSAKDRRNYYFGKKIIEDNLYHILISYFYILFMILIIYHSIYNIYFLIDEIIEISIYLIDLIF